MTTFSTPNMVEGHPFRQWRKWNIPNTTFTIEGYSRSGDKTFFYIPQLKLCLDAALAEGRQGDYVLVTHTHNDHIADIEYLASRDGVQIYLPKASQSYLEEYIIARRCLNHSAPYNPHLRGSYNITGVAGGDTFYIGKNDRYQVKVVNCEHSIVCVGYAFAEKKQRLKPEYEALKQQKMTEGKMQEFGQLMAQKKQEAKQKGETVEETYYQPLFVFMGDTHASVFDNNAWLFDYPTIITECTFLKPVNEAYANERCHTHWKHLKPHINQHPKCQFVLTHFSFRYTSQEIVDFFEQELTQSQINNVLIWLSSDTLLPQQHESKK
ncbi:MBL fold metallo-hydrolase [uncultured Microscilla sp.]|uniref:MBL fold metallo-hydrolase n=1 Tax=uncultured Microscilla sp. TaxID=432653 RepID=UPI0026303258|nr:MBL fold metallo-hydrolase [uncultured Microscilla sp.]